ncbi:hypothetical protein DPMN_124600, partial [Dreissena polymorpha]
KFAPIKGLVDAEQQSLLVDRFDTNGLLIRKPIRANGKDGDPQAVHEVLYKGEDSPYEVDGLQRDLDEGSLKFVDI